MGGRRLIRSRLAGLTVGVLLALFLWPATGWILRSNMRLAFPTAGRVAPWAPPTQVTASEYRERAYGQTAARHPDDLALQLAAAMTVPPDSRSFNSIVKVERLRSLVDRFPASAALRAAILRISTQGEVRIDREETDWLVGSPPDPNRARQLPGSNTAAALAAFDRDAAEGERLDQENAYFPLMRAVGFFAGGRDAEAIDALVRASRKPVWTEYYSDEAEAEWKLHERTFGQTGVLPRVGLAYMILLPQYAQFRGAARVAVAKAAQAEKDGRVEDGLAIREAVARCGRLMRVQSRCAIGSLVGIAVTKQSILRPAAASPIRPHGPGGPARPRTADPDADPMQEQLRAYTAYLRKTGHGDRISAIEAELAAGARVGEIVKPNDRSSLYAGPVTLSGWWIAAQAVINNALWMLILGGIAALLARHRSIRTGTGWAKGAHPAWAIGVLIGGFFLIGVLRWQVSESTRPLVWTLLSYMVPFDSMQSRTQEVETLITWVAMAVPVLTLATLGLLSLLWRAPLSVGVVRGLRGLAVPIACGLFLVYAALLPFMVRQEAALETALQRTVQHEGRYLAEIGGVEWPD